MKQYSAYKNSGHEWFPMIPNQWKVIKLGKIGSFSASGIDKKSDVNELSVRMVNYTDVYGNPYLEIRSSQDLMETTTTSEKIKEHSLRKGDMVFTPSSETAEDIGLSAVVMKDLHDTVYSYHLIRYRANEHFSLDLGFKKYFCNTHEVLSQFSKACKGTTRQILGRDDFKETLVLLPPTDEQKAVSTYLDRKTLQIDDLIAKKKQMIELLEGERVAIINQAVTKGLNPKAEMKDSGAEWLDKIPKHWEIKKIQYLGRFQNGISESLEYFGSGYPFVSYGDVYNNISLPLKVEGLAQSSEDERKRLSVETGDVFFTRTSETIEEIGISSVCMEKIIDAVFSGFIIRFRPTTVLLTKEFSKYYFRSVITRKFFIKEMNIVTRASLAQDLLKKLPVLLPPPEEQKKIFQYLEEKSKEICAHIEREQRSIRLLKEYRTSLISEVMTGKIDVRGEVNV